MTKEEILTMDAGRELDKEIALALGYTIIETIPGRYSLAGVEEISGRMQFKEVALPHYSTDISPAWQLVEKLFSKGYHVTVMTVNILEPEPKYKVLVQQIVRIGTPKDYEVEAKTAPEAICVAALLAKLRQVVYNMGTTTE